MVHFWRAGRAFEVRDITTLQHAAVVDQFARDHQMRLTHEGNTAILEFQEGLMAHTVSTAKGS